MIFSAEKLWGLKCDMGGNRTSVKGDASMCRGVSVANVCIFRDYRTCYSLVLRVLHVPIWGLSSYIIGVMPHVVMY